MGTSLAVLAAFIVALPELLKLILAIVDWFKKNKRTVTLENIEEKIDAVEKADDSASKVEAARGISGLIRKLTK